ncbi:MAG: hypothetical protein K9N35_06810 [Candidatus Marinimicrobia bacterium]|nr:hypothetical protein [Candidatus Neomarinimicrobiota bacterium]
MFTKQYLTRLTVMLITLLMVPAMNAQNISQKYPKGKIYLANGMNLEGKNLRMTPESVTVEIMGQDQTFMLTDVIQIMAKQDKGKRFGKICAGSCVGISLLSLLAGPEVTETDAYGNQVVVEQDAVQSMIGVVIWAGISYGVGYLAGTIADDWEIVYLNR